MPNVKIPWVLSPVLREPGMVVPVCNLSSQEDQKPRSSSAPYRVLEHPGTYDVRDWISEKAGKSRFLNNGLFLLSFLKFFVSFLFAMCEQSHSCVSTFVCVCVDTHC